MSASLSSWWSVERLVCASSSSRRATKPSSAHCTRRFFSAMSVTVPVTPCTSRSAATRPFTGNGARRVGIRVC